MPLIAVAAWLGNLLCDTAGQLAFKAASLRSHGSTGWRHWALLLRQPLLWLGIAAFLAEPLLWLAFLSMVPLSQGVMLGSANILGVMLGGWLFFHERLTARRIAAIALIGTGVVLVGWGQA